IEKARKENMPSENIERAVARGLTGEGGTLDPVRYEAYGPGGIALIIEGLTDNTNRTGSEIKHLLSKHGLELAAPGSAAWAFDRVDGGWVAKTTTPLSEKDRAALALLLEELNDHDDVQEIYTSAAPS
ncbi:MAG TPA: YebC/PmpR family DNA-binding transcriptional regulator, partial [Candidatus Paceibacterota bacterium]